MAWGSCLRHSGALFERNCQGSFGCESRLLCDQRDSCSPASYASGLACSRRQRRLRLQVWRDRRGQDPRRGLHFVEVDENFKAYNLFTHRHTPEILEHTGLSESQVVFSTHLLPLARGILSTIYVTLGEPQTAADIESLYRQFYAGRPMVRIWPAGTLPELQHVAHTNFCDIGFALDKSGRRLVIVSCLDNLGKGAAGQAVQNFNHMLQIEEQTSLQ